MMIRMFRRAAIAVALLAMFTSTSFAGRAAAKPAKDGRSARPAVQKNRAARGKSTAVTVRAIRSSKSGKSTQVLSATRGSNKVEAYNVSKKDGTARRTNTGLMSQSKAKAKAHQVARRENNPKKGTFSGVEREGLTKRGNFKFGSKTDANQKVFVNPVSGRTVNRDPSRAKKPASKPAAQAQSY